MALLKDRVKESTTTTGTGTLTLTGTVSGYRRFSSALSNADVTYYCIESGADWEVGIGTYSANTLTRDTVLASSNAGSLINITASRSFVFITYAADKAVYENSAGYVQIDSGIYFPDGTTQTTAFGGSVSVSATGISNVPPSSILGNNTASTGYSSGLTPSNVRTLLGLATTSDVTFDIVRATTSVLTPLVNNTNAAALIVGNSTYGISSPGSITLGAMKYLWTATGPEILVGRDDGGFYVCGGATGHSESIYIGTSSSPVKIQSNAILGGMNAALTLGNSTYGVTVPGAALFTSNSGVTATPVSSSSNGGFTASGWNYASFTATGASGAGGAFVANAGANQGIFTTYGDGGSMFGVTRTNKTVVVDYTGTGLLLGSVNGSTQIASNNVVRLTLDTAGVATFSGNALVTNANVNSCETRVTNTSSNVSGYLAAGGTAGFSNAVYASAVYLEANGAPLHLSSYTGAVKVFTNHIERLSIAVSTGAATFSGDISMSKTSAQGYIRAYYTDGSRNTFMYHNGSSGFLDSSYGAMIVKGNYSILQPSTAISYCYTPGTNSQFHVYNTNAGNGLVLSTDGTNAAITTFGGAGLTIAPASGTVAVTGAVTTTGKVGIGGAASGHYMLRIAATGNQSQIALDATLGSGSEAGLLLYSAGALRYQIYDNGSSSGLGIYNAGTASHALQLNYTTNNATFIGSVSCAGITASGNLSYAQGLSTGTVTKSANYTTTADDYCVNVTANSIDITFETAVGCANREHEVINTGVGTVTLKTTSSQTISGNASGALTLTQYQVIRVKSDGSNWLIMSRVT